MKRSGRGLNPGPRASEEDALSTPLRPAWLSEPVVTMQVFFTIFHTENNRLAVLSVIVKDRDCKSSLAFSNLRDSVFCNSLSRKSFGKVPEKMSCLLLSIREYVETGCGKKISTMLLPMQTKTS